MQRYRTKQGRFAKFSSSQIVNDTHTHAFSIILLALTINLSFRCAICCVGSMYEKLGRMMGRSYEETIQILLKSLKNAESQMRIEILVTLEKVCAGMGTAISNEHRDIYKATKFCLSDRVMAVRVAEARLLLEMLNHAPFLYTTELESIAPMCFRAFDGSNYEVRCAVANFLGNLIALTQQPPKQVQNAVQGSKTLRPTSLDEAFGILMSGFLRGGVSFLKGTGEMIKGSSGVNREVRVGLTHVCIFKNGFPYMSCCNRKVFSAFCSRTWCLFV